MKTTFEQVKDWMDEAGQPTPQGVILPSDNVLSLRKELIEEEVNEFFFEHHKVYKDEAVTINYIKELADLAIVVLGGFVDLGLDGDEVISLVMENNFKKLKAKSFDTNGKVITDKETKARLKEEINQRLQQLIETNITHEELEERIQDGEFIEGVGDE